MSNSKFLKDRQFDVEFDEKTHIYKINGTKCVSVTQLLGDMGFNDYSHIPAHILDKARIRGTYVHKAIELHLKGILNEDTLDQQIVPYLNGFKKFQREHTLKTFAIEERLGHKTLLAAGTADWRGEFDGIHSFLDWKVTFEVKKTSALQVNGGYPFLYNANVAKVEDRVPHGRIVQIKKDDYALMPEEFYSRDNQDEFMHLLLAWHIRKMYRS